MTSEKLNELRIGIDDLDSKIIQLIADRFSLTRQVGQIKSHSNIDPVDPDREEFVLDKWEKLAIDADVDPALARALIRLIIDQSVAEHRAVRQEGD